MRLRNEFLCFAFLILLDVCLLGILFGSGESTRSIGSHNVSSNDLSGDIPPIVALTFDDGPTKYTSELLDGLAERNVKVTFFVLGMKLSGNEDIIKRMHEEGHVIGNHTYNHINLSQHSQEEDCEEIELTNQKIYEITGVMPTYIRPPFGRRNVECECSIDMTLILWNVDPVDWNTSNKNKVVSHVVKKVKDNDIILLHDISKSSVDAALEIVDKLQAQGWQFVTVDGLMPD